MNKKFLYILTAIAFVLILLTMCDKEPPAASFTHSSGSYEAGDTIYFDNTSSNADSYEWDFGDGNTSTEKNPRHIFENTGNYSVVLIVANNNGTDEISQPVTIKDPTILSIIVNQTGTTTPVANCIIKVFDNQSDWENEIDEVWEDFTDNDGIVTFYHARAIVYYIHALKLEAGGAWFYTGVTDPLVLNEINTFMVGTEWISGKKAFSP